MFKTVLAVAASAVVVFLWGFISWSTMPWHLPKDFADGQAVADVMKDQVTEPGIYAYPSQSRTEARTAQAITDEIKAGPFIWATVRPGPREDFNMGTNMLLQLVVVILASVTMVFLIQKSKHDSFFDRLSMAVLAGLLLGIMSAFPQRIFLETPTSHTIAHFLDGLIPWTLAGIVIAAILPQRSTRA